jgi:hypothetical protein
MGTGQAPDSISRDYVFDNAAAHAGARFRALSEIFDPGTIRLSPFDGIRFLTDI